MRFSMRGSWRVLLALSFTARAVLAEELTFDPAITRIAFGSCNREYKPQPLWKPILDCKPDLWIWLGDIVYGDSEDLANLAQRYHAQKIQADYAALRARSKVVGVWDDHDFGVANGGKSNPAKNESQRLLLDFLDEPPDSPRRAQAGVYAAYAFGPPGRQVKVILLDGRFHRGPSWRLLQWFSGIAESDMLGEEQWKWLEQQLSGSTADVHLIGSGVQVIASEHRYEKWADFPHSRRRLFDLLARTGARNPIFLSGDRHFGEISRLVDPRIPQTLYDVTSSGLTHHAEDRWFRSFSRETNHFRCGNNFLGLNFGLVEINWEAVPQTATFQIRDIANAVRVEEKITLAAADAGTP